jgi:hypothetical protein
VIGVCEGVSTVLPCLGEEDGLRVEYKMNVFVSSIDPCQVILTSEIYSRGKPRVSAEDKRTC